MYLNGEGPLPPPAVTTKTVRRQGPPVGRRARGTWTATLDYVQKTLHLGAMLIATQDGKNEYARDKRPGGFVTHVAGCYAAPRRSRPKPYQPDLFVPRYASMLQILPASRFASNSIAPRAANASLGTTSAPFWCFRPAWIWCFRPAWNYAPGHAYWNQDPK